MAILPACEGITVTVVANRQELEEYPDENRTITHTKFSTPPNHLRSMSYIECLSDAEFGIKCTISSDYKPDVPHTYLRFHMYVDGKEIGCGSGKIPASGTTVFSIKTTQDRVSAHEVVERKLVFRTIQKSMFPPQAPNIPGLTVYS